MPARQLGNNLSLGHLENEEDAQQFITLHQTHTGEGDICDRLIHHKPGVTLQDFYVVKDTSSGKVVSTSCFLPWVLHLDGVELKAAQLEMVITRPDYRQQGLVRELVRHFQQVAVNRGFDFSLITGIPYFYRQFGYSYSLDLDRYITLPTSWIPDGEQAGGVRFRPPQPDDSARLVESYQAAMAHQQAWVRRGVEDWQYFMNPMWRPLTVIERASDGAWLGYLWGRFKDGVFSLSENAVDAPENIPAVLAKIRQEYPGELRVFGNPADPLYQAVAALGGSEPPPYQYLIHVPDTRSLLARIAPVLEKRLALAGYHHLSTHLLINVYRQAVELVIEDGRVTEVAQRGFVDTSTGAPEISDLCIPPDAFARLVFGYRGLDELKDAWPDVLTLPKSRRLLDILFPRLSALVLMPY